MIKRETVEAFQGSQVLLTGASSGLGKCFALALAKECNVKTLILSARRKDALEEVANLCRQGNPSPPDIHVIVCDLADPKSVANLGVKASELCDVDVLINNGGISSRSKFIETDVSVDEKVMQVNFLSGAALAKALVPKMAKGGKIIWISSVQGLVGIPNRSSYAASKFAVQGYCESIRGELKGQGISVHTVSPGYINTNLSRSAVTGDGKAYGKTDATTASGADPTELANAILDKVANGEADFTIAAPLSAVAAIWLRLLCPGLLRNLLVKRFEKSEKEKTD